MSKAKSITFLSILGVLIAAFIFFTFASFSVGTKDYVGLLRALDYDYDIDGGTSYTLTLSDDNDESIEDIESVSETIGTRLSKLGYENYSITALRRTDKETVLDDVSYSLRITVKTEENNLSDITAVSAYGEVKLYGGSSENPTDEIMTKEKAINNSEYVGTSVSNNQTVYLTSIEFTDYGYDELMDLINNNETAYLKIALGDTTLFNGTISSGGISGKTVYMQLTSESAAKQTALQVSTGGLPYKFEVGEGLQTSPMLGENTFNYVWIAVFVLFIACVVALFIKYKSIATVGAMTLFFFLFIYLWMLIAIPGITVSIGSILGILFALLLAFDGIIISFKRVTEESEKGKTVKSSFKVGYKRALVPVINSSVLSAIVALLLLLFTRGTIKMFAITFGIGIVVSCIACLLFTRFFTLIILPLIKNEDSIIAKKEAE